TDTKASVPAEVTILSQRLDRTVAHFDAEDHARAHTSIQELNRIVEDARALEAQTGLTLFAPIDAVGLSVNLACVDNKVVGFGLLIDGLLSPEAKTIERFAKAGKLSTKEIPKDKLVEHLSTNLPAELSTQFNTAIEAARASTQNTATHLKTIEDLGRHVTQDLGVIPAVFNDGDALAFYVAVREQGSRYLVLSLGSGLASGYVDELGLVADIMGEAGAVHVDMHPEAPAIMPNDKGGLRQYISQRAIIDPQAWNLAQAYSIDLSGLTDKDSQLAKAQSLFNSNDPADQAKAEEIFTLIGEALAVSVYTLNRNLVNYVREKSRYTDKTHPVTTVLVVGRVTRDKAGETIVNEANRYLHEVLGLTHITVVLPKAEANPLRQEIAKRFAQLEGAAYYASQVWQDSQENKQVQSSSFGKEERLGRAVDQLLSAYYESRQYSPNSAFSLARSLYELTGDTAYLEVMSEAISLYRELIAQNNDPAAYGAGTMEMSAELLAVSKDARFLGIAVEVLNEQLAYTPLSRNFKIGYIAKLAVEISKLSSDPQYVMALLNKIAELWPDTSCFARGYVPAKDRHVYTQEISESYADLAEAISGEIERIQMISLQEKYISAIYELRISARRALAEMQVDTQALAQYQTEIAALHSHLVAGYRAHVSGRNNEDEAGVFSDQPADISRLMAVTGKILVRLFAAGLHFGLWHAAQTDIYQASPQEILRIHRHTPDRRIHPVAQLAVVMDYYWSLLMEQLRTDRRRDLIREFRIDDVIEGKPVWRIPVKQDYIDLPGVGMIDYLAHLAFTGPYLKDLLPINQGNVARVVARLKEMALHRATEEEIDLDIAPISSSWTNPALVLYPLVSSDAGMREDLTIAIESGIAEEAERNSYQTANEYVSAAYRVTGQSKYFRALNAMMLRAFQQAPRESLLRLRNTVEALEAAIEDNEADDQVQTSALGKEDNLTTAALKGLLSIQHDLEQFAALTPERASQLQELQEHIQSRGPPLAQAVFEYSTREDTTLLPAEHKAELLRLHTLALADWKYSFILQLYGNSTVALEAALWQEATLTGRTLSQIVLGYLGANSLPQPEHLGFSVSRPTPSTQDESAFETDYLFLGGAGFNISAPARSILDVYNRSLPAHELRKKRVVTLVTAHIDDGGNSAAVKTVVEKKYQTSFPAPGDPMTAAIFFALDKWFKDYGKYTDHKDFAPTLRQAKTDLHLINKNRLDLTSAS
ncbi:MAG: hypothetical protein PHD09_06665, partial [Candidatus Omnitrophica bacterium]|nr:hypothetical protein [Candidatus Omnitrophota bacterium]